MVPEGWVEKKLGEILEFKNGVNSDSENFGSGVKFVNVMDIFGHDVLSEDQIIGRVEVTPNQFETYSLEFGDILFNRTSETNDEIAYSSVYLDDGAAVFGGFVIRGRPLGQDLCALFSRYCFKNQTIRKEFIRRCQGAVRANIGQKDMSKIPVLLPPIPEQKKIAEILSTWDRAIETVEKLIENSNTQKKAIMQRLLTGKKRFKEFEGEMWREVRLNDFSVVKLGSSPKSENYNEEKIGLPLIQGNADIFQRISAPRIFTSEITQECAIGDVLLSVRAPVGDVARSIHNGCIGRGIASISAKQNFNQDFVYQLLLWSEKRWAKYSQGTTFEAINGKDIKNCKFVIPLSSAEQEKIAEILQINDAEITSLSKNVDALKTQKKALMQQLLTGKRRVKVEAA